MSPVSPRVSGLARLGGILLTAAVSLASAQWLVTVANPEVRFWRGALERKAQECETLPGRSDNGMVLFAGGSSCAFSIMPDLITERTGLPAWNMGGHAGAGPRFLSAFALEHARPGDTVVLALEEESISSSEAGEITQVGLALAVSLGMPDLAAGAPVLPDPVSWRDRFTFLRPGSRFGAAMLAKRLSGRPLYRYVDADYKAGGRIETPYLDGGLIPEVFRKEPRHLSPSGRLMLERLADYARERGIRLVYSMPWMFNDPALAEGNRASHRVLLEEVAKILPVLPDEKCGVETNPAYFSDTSYHLTGVGARARTERVAEGLLALGIAKGPG